MPQHLPEVDFHIAVPTLMSERLESLENYKNVTFYRGLASQDVIADLLDKMDIYLDINYGEEVNQILSQVEILGKEILSFDTVTHSSISTSRIYPSDEPQRLVKTIKRKLVETSDVENRHATDFMEGKPLV